MMATKTSLAYGCCTPTMRRMRAGYEDDYLFRDSADSPIYDARPTLPQTMEESSDQILDKLELAGRVPSKEKFRRMACNTFIYTGICPYNDRCVFLHDHRIKAENVKIRTTRQTKASNAIKDTFYWPDMTRKDVARILDPQGLPSANQMYIVPEAFKLNPGNFHNRGLYSTWMHFVEFCVHNSPFYTVKRFRDLTTEPFFLVSGYRENPHVPGAKRLDSFIRLSLGRGVIKPPAPPNVPHPSATNNNNKLLMVACEGSDKKSGNGSVAVQAPPSPSPSPSQVLPKLAGASSAVASKRRVPDPSSQITPDSSSSVNQSFFGGGPPRQAQRGLNAHAAHFEMPSSSRSAVTNAAVPMLKKITAIKIACDEGEEGDDNKGLGIDIVSSMDSLTEDLYDKPSYPSSSYDKAKKDAVSMSFLFNAAVTNNNTSFTTATTTAVTTTSTALAGVDGRSRCLSNNSGGLFSASTSTPLWLDSLSGHSNSVSAGGGGGGGGGGLFDLGPFSSTTGTGSEMMLSDKGKTVVDMKSGTSGSVFDYHNHPHQWSPASGLLPPDFGLLDESTPPQATSSKTQVIAKVDGEGSSYGHGHVSNGSSGNGGWVLDSLIEPDQSAAAATFGWLDHESDQPELFSSLW